MSLSVLGRLRTLGTAVEIRNKFHTLPWITSHTHDLAAERCHRQKCRPPGMVGCCARPGSSSVSMPASSLSMLLVIGLSAGAAATSSAVAADCCLRRGSSATSVSAAKSLAVRTQLSGSWSSPVQAMHGVCPSPDMHGVR